MFCRSSIIWVSWAPRPTPGVPLPVLKISPVRSWKFREPSQQSTAADLLVWVRFHDTTSSRLFVWKSVTAGIWDHVNLFMVFSLSLSPPNTVWGRGLWVHMRRSVSIHWPKMPLFFFILGVKVSWNVIMKIHHSGSSTSYVKLFNCTTPSSPFFPLVSLVFFDLLLIFIWFVSLFEDLSVSLVPLV